MDRFTVTGLAFHNFQIVAVVLASASVSGIIADGITDLESQRAGHFKSIQRQDTCDTLGETIQAPSLDTGHAPGNAERQAEPIVLEVGVVSQRQLYGNTERLPLDVFVVDIK